MLAEEFAGPAEYFAGHYAEVWRAITPPEDTAAELAYLTARLAPEQTLLDVMCGAGRHSDGLAAAGYEVTGVDAHRWSSEASDGAGDDSAPWERVVSDVTAWTPGRTWDAALCLGNSLTGFSRPELVDLLTRVRSWVRPGGQLFVQAWTVAEVAYRRGFDPVSFSVGDYSCELSGEFHLRPARWESEQRISRDGQLLETLRSVDYLYGANELEDALAEAGFVVSEIHGDFDGRPFAFGDLQQLFVARAV